MTNTDLLGCKLTHYSLSGVLFESWKPSFTGVVRCVEPDGSSVLLEIVEIHDPDHSQLEVGSLLRVGVMGGSKERLSTVQPPVVEKPKTEEATAEAS